MKVITICGSVKFYDDMIRAYERWVYDGWCVLGMLPLAPQTPEQIAMLKANHYKKIELSDAIFVVTKDGYIGNSTKNEIEYAKSLGKEILYSEKNEIIK